MWSIIHAFWSIVMLDHDWMTRFTNADGSLDRVPLLYSMSIHLVFFCMVLNYIGKPLLVPPKRYMIKGIDSAIDIVMAWQAKRRLTREAKAHEAELKVAMARVADVMDAAKVLAEALAIEHRRQGL